ncbi:MAG: hypothetical protein H8E66_11720 [Planctomycetes bacterium]|nr:hypothetical protein [Planctomycetota bacterium]
MQINTMQINRIRILVACLVFTGLAAGRGEKRVDVRKGRIETPLKVVVAEQAADVRKSVDARKFVIESSVKSLVGKETTGDEPPSEELGEGKENSRVQPGLVRWHPDWEHAKLAGAQSGKPILLFQLLGQLDREFT